MASDSDPSMAAPEQRAAALEIVLRRKGELPETSVADFTEHAEEKWITVNYRQRGCPAGGRLGHRCLVLNDEARGDGDAMY